MSKATSILNCLLVGALVCLLQLDRAGAAATSPDAVRKSPAWLQSAVVYEIFPRNFSKEGDLHAITGRLDELKDLGVNVLLLMPIQPIGKEMRKGSLGSPYCIRDFYGINPDYGTTNDFKLLVEEAHKRGLKVVMDLVAGYTAWDNDLITKHPEFYQKDANGKIVPPRPEWNDVAALNYENGDLRRYMIDMMSCWLRDYSVDGFRCDVAYIVPVDFWESARVELEKVNPDLVILSDGGAKPALLSKAFDMDYSWHLAFALDNVMSNVKPAYFIEQSWKHTQKQFPKGALHLRYSDNHAETRAIARYGMAGALAAQTLMLTLDGVPLFYNGMEVGDAGESVDPALFEKLPIFWNPAGRPPLRDIYRDLIKLRKQYPAFCNDEVVWLQNTASGEVVTFQRRDTKDEFIVLINLSSRQVAGTVELSDTTGYAPVSISGMPGPVDALLPDFRLRAYGWFIYHRSVGK